MLSARSAPNPHERLPAALHDLGAKGAGVLGSLSGSIALARAAGMRLVCAFGGPMTVKKRFKRRVRDRARKTGESYTAALAHVRQRPEQELSMSDQLSNAWSASSGEVTGTVIVVSGPGGVGKSTVSRLLAARFDRSVHLNTDDFMAAVVSGWADPNLPGADQQNEAVGGAFAV